MSLEQILRRLRRLQHRVLHLQKRTSKTRSFFKRQIQNLLAHISSLQQIVAQLQNQINELADVELFAFIRSQLQALDQQNAIVTISTAAGDITGTIEVVGEDFVAIREAGGSIVIIHFSQINAIS